MFKKILPIVLAVSLYLFFPACQTEEIFERDYPMVRTLPADHIAFDGARLNAVITEGSLESIFEYGFIWGSSIALSISDTEKVSVAGSPSAESYYYDIMHVLEDQRLYYVRSYIKSGDLIIYGNIVSFNTLSSSSVAGKRFFNNHP